MSRVEELITACECCQGVTALTPVTLDNRPGLSALVYRVGTHASFKVTMLAHLSTKPALQALSSRQDDDLAIALLDGWATVADVLTFYQERIANEGFLRTATERRSLLELARTIGYELRPGVAASTYLAFTVDDSPGSPEQVVIPAGARAQSLPDKDQLPQSFETSEEIVAYAEWNALTPRLTRPQLFDTQTDTFYFTGTVTGLKPGDWVLVQVGTKKNPEDPGQITITPRQVERVDPDQLKQHTKVTLAKLPVGAAPTTEAAAIVRTTPPKPPGSVFLDAAKNLTTDAASALLTQYAWTQDEVTIFEKLHGFGRGEMATIANKNKANINKNPTGPKPPAGAGVYAFRVKTAPFGHNAPRWNTLPREWREEASNGTIQVVGATRDVDGVEKEAYNIAAAYPFNWGDFWWIHVDSRIRRYAEIYGEEGTDREVLLLESNFPTIREKSWILVENFEGKLTIYQAVEVAEVSRADFALNARVTRLTVAASNHSAISEISQKHESRELPQFTLRETTIYAQSELLELAGDPIEEPIQGSSVELDRMVVHALSPGRRLILSGERLDNGLEVSEVVVLKEVEHPGGFTTLTFEVPLAHAYRRHTVTLTANVALATHGETRQEILGSGDAAEAFQRFALRQKPLTYVPASEPSGGRSTLELRVDGMRWHEAPDLYRLGPRERDYALHLDDEGNTVVLFGDGKHGARLATGTENVTATYRTGIGLEGLVKAGQISLLAARPLGVREVTNPLPSSGAADPESRDQARQSAPLTVLTLDRIVSLQDFEDFARAFSGIAKAKATWAWDGESRVVFLTVAGVGGAAVAENSLLYDHLKEAMDRVRDPFPMLRIASYEPRLFDLHAAVRGHPDYEEEVVRQAVKEKLSTAFSFEAREFAQDVYLSEVMALIQNVDGVEAVDVNRLHFSHERLPSTRLRGTSLISQGKPAVKQGQLVADRLPALPARFETSGTTKPAQLLTISVIRVAEMP